MRWRENSLRRSSAFIMKSAASSGSLRSTPLPFWSIQARLFMAMEFPRLAAFLFSALLYAFLFAVDPYDTGKFGLLGIMIAIISARVHPGVSCTMR